MLKPAPEPTLSPKNLKTSSFWTIIYIESEREIRAIRAYNPYYFPKNCRKNCRKPTKTLPPTYKPARNPKKFSSRIA